MQGQTVKRGSKVVVNWSRRLPPALGYMMLSRSESIKDLFIAGDFDETKLKCDSKALEEVERLEKISLSNLPICNEDSNQLLGFAFVNIRSLNKNYEHLMIDTVMLQH